jgi:hypothetical protein
VALAVPRGLDLGGSSLPQRPTLHPDLVLISGAA